MFQIAWKKRAKDARREECDLHNLPCEAKRRLQGAPADIEVDEALARSRDALRRLLNKKIRGLELGAESTDSALVIMVLNFTSSCLKEKNLEIGLIVSVKIAIL